MKVQKFSHYSKLYESRLIECDFLVEQNITLGDIIEPLQDIITEEFIGDWLRKKASGGSKLAQTALNVGGSIATGIKNLAQTIGGAFTAVFKFFKLDKLTKAIADTIKNSALYKSIKEGLASLASWSLQNGIVDENNIPNLKKIWSVLSAKCKSLLTGTGVSQSELDKAGQSLPTMQNASKNHSYTLDKINEADAKAIGDDEIKYYGFFEKVVHALGIQNARFNGVVSQILKKGTIGIAIMGILKVAGFSLAGLTAGLALSPVALAAIGGMLLMAGLIILAIWICKPYPTLEDCLAYLHLYFTNNSSEDLIDSDDIEQTSQTDAEDSTTSSSSNSETEGGSKEVLSEKSLYPAMIKNLKALQSMIISFEGVGIAGESSSIATGDTDIKYVVGKEYDFTNKQGETKRVLLKSITHDTKIGPDDKWATADDIQEKPLSKGKGSVVWKDKNGKYSKSSPEMAVSLSQLKPVRESILTYSIFEKEFSKEFSKQPRKVEITKEEDYLVQAFKNTQKSLKVLKDEKDKGIGITDSFIEEILSRKMDSEAKKSIKALYEEVYEHLYGKYSKTMSDLGPLYKESVEIISDKSKRKIVAEKIARLAKRTMQFEGENMYASLGEFGADMRDFNTTLKQIMDSFKSVKESHKSVFFFQEFIK